MSLWAFVTRPISRKLPWPGPPEMHCAKVQFAARKMRQNDSEMRYEAIALSSLIPYLINTFGLAMQVGHVADSSPRMIEVARRPKASQHERPTPGSLCLPVRRRAPQEVLGAGVGTPGLAILWLPSSPAIKPPWGRLSRGGVFGKRE